MPLYKTLVPLTYEAGDNKVIHITEVGRIIELSTDQAALLVGRVLYISSGSDFLAPEISLLGYDSNALFPTVGSPFHVYLDQNAGLLYQWSDVDLDYTLVSDPGGGDPSDVAGSIHAAAGKTTPVDADEFGLVDSAASNVLKKVTWANIKATFKAYYDSVTKTLTNTTFNANGTGNSITNLEVGDFSGAAVITAAEVASINSDTVLVTGAGVKAYADSVGGGGGGLANVVEDTTPQLGGDLDPNGHTVGDATAADLTKLHALTPTSTELNFVDGVTSAIQTQIDAKQAADVDLTALAALSAPATKLAGIATGATANSTDATLLARGNHTGTQSADTVIDGSTNHVFTAADDTKLTGIATGAEVNVNADWNSVSGDSQILNRPTLATVATSGAYADLAGIPSNPGELVPVALGVYGNSIDAATSSSAGTGRAPFQAAVTCTDLVLGWCNWRTNSTAIETDNATTVVFKAAVEVAGVLWPLTFRGSATATMDSGGQIFSDPVSVDLNAGDNFYVRTFISSGTWFASRIAWATGQGGWTVTTDLTPAGSAAITDNNSFTSLPAPNFILGKTAGKSCVVLGDSIGYGSGDGIGAGLGTGLNTVDLSLSAGGFMGIACKTGAIGLLNLACPSDQATKFVAGHVRRAPLARYGRTIVCEYARNDMARTLAQIQADLITIWTSMKLRNPIARRFQTTIDPQTTSTDGWLTTTNQTSTANLTTRNNLNAWLRDGAPTVAGAAVAAGSNIGVADRCKVLSGATLVSDAFGAHLLYGIADVGSEGETTTTSGVWKAADNVRSLSDAAITSATNVLTSATANFQSTDRGRTVTIAGAGAAGVLFVNVIKSINSTTSVNVGSTAGTTVSGAVLKVGDFYTNDGIHPTHYAHGFKAAKVPVADFK